MGTTRCLRWWLLFTVITESKTRPRDPQKQEGQSETNIRRPGSQRRNSKSQLTPHPHHLLLTHSAPHPFLSLNGLSRLIRQPELGVPGSPSALSSAQSRPPVLVSLESQWRPHTCTPNLQPPVPLAHEWKQLLKASRREMGTEGVRVWVGTARE